METYDDDNLNPINEPNDEQTRDCERCGRDRPADPERFALAKIDFTDASAAYEKTLLCRDCWEGAGDRARRPIA